MSHQSWCYLCDSLDLLKSGLVVTAPITAQSQVMKFMVSW